MHRYYMTLEFAINPTEEVVKEYLNDFPDVDFELIENDIPWVSSPYYSKIKELCKKYYNNSPQSHDDIIKEDTDIFVKDILKIIPDGTDKRNVYNPLTVEAKTFDIKKGLIVKVSHPTEEEFFEIIDIKTEIQRLTTNEMFSKIFIRGENTCWFNANMITGVMNEV